MKSKISLFNLAIFKQNCRRLWLWLAGLTASYLFLYIGSLHAQFYWVREEGTGVSALDYYQAVVSVVTDMHGFLIYYNAVAALITAMFVFSYLFTPRNTNMVHTFPLNRKSLFLTNYVTGLLVLLVSLVIPTIAAQIYAAPHYAALVGKLYFIELFILFGSDFLFFNLAVLVLMFVGNPFAVPVLYAILNYLYLGGMLLLNVLIQCICYGIMDIDLRVNMLTPIEYFSDFIRMAKLNDDVRSIVFEGKMQFFCYLVVAVVFGILAYIAYVKKQIETAGDLITVRWLKPIFQWSGAFCAAVLAVAVYLSIFFMGNEHVGFGVVYFGVIFCGTVAFFLIQMLLDKTFRVIRKKVCYSCLAFVACVSVLLVSLHGDVFGIERYVPDASKVKMAMFRMPAAGNQWQLADEKEEIETVRSMHQYILTNRPSFNDYEPEFQITYIMENGKTVNRSYPFAEYSEDETVLELARQSEEYASQKEHALESMFGIHPESVTPIRVTYGWYDEKTEVYSEEDVKEKEVRQIYQALLKDIEDGSYTRALAKEATGRVEEGEFFDERMTLEFSVGKDNRSIDELRLLGYDAAFERTRSVQILVSADCTHLVKAIGKIDPKLLKMMKEGAYY